MPERADEPTSNLEDLNFFRDKSIVEDPYPYFEALRGKCPVHQEPHQAVYMVTGYDEAIAVYHDTDTFSNCNAVSGPWTKFPVPIVGDDITDITDIIEKYRDTLPFSDQLPTFDPPKHTAHRALLMRLITPKRLKENEEFMWRLADQVIDEFHATGECEFVHDFANPFTLLVVADLLGVPESDHDELRAKLGDPTKMGRGREAHKPLEFLYDKFVAYIEDRRRSPQSDVMTELATATFPDGSTPEVMDVALIAGNLFAAGQETTARLLAFALKLIGEDTDLQKFLRGDRDRIPNFIEETLRLENPIKGEFRLARTPTTVGGVHIPAGGTVYVCNSAANRDARMFDDPAAFIVDRLNARQHVAFGHGIHTCAGAPLARAEARVSVERLLERMSSISISEAAHGPADARRYDYVPTYMLRGLETLHLEFTPTAPTH